jgi:hypothetical protein
MMPLPGFQKPIPYFWDAEERNSNTSYTRPTISDYSLSVVQHYIQLQLRANEGRASIHLVRDFGGFEILSGAGLCLDQVVAVGGRRHGLSQCAVGACGACAGVRCGVCRLESVNNGAGG